MPREFDEDNQADRWEIWKIVVPIGLLFLFLIGSLIGPGDEGQGDDQAEKQEQPKPEDKPDKVEAWVMAQQFVKDNLKSPKTADFGWQDAEEIVTETAENKFRVSAWVDSENSFGANLRTRFVCDVKYVGDGNWRLVGLKFAE